MRVIQMAHQPVSPSIQPPAAGACVKGHEAITPATPRTRPDPRPAESQGRGALWIGLPASCITSAVFDD